MAWKLRFPDGVEIPLYGGACPKEGESNEQFVEGLRKAVRQGPGGCRFGVLTVDAGGNPGFRPLTEEEHKLLGSTNLLDMIDPKTGQPLMALA